MLHKRKSLLVWSARFCSARFCFSWFRRTMAEESNAPASASGDNDNEEIEETPGYKPPAQKSLAEIADLDKDDESLVKYKKELLGEGGGDVLDEGGKNVLVKQLAIKISDRDDIKIDLTGDISKLKDIPIVLKEGCEYRVEISFRVQREIVAGLKYFQRTYRKGIQVDKGQFMVGSYGPKKEAHVYLTPVEEAPKGMMARGHYTVKSKFTDDDKEVYLEWEWAFDIKKDWH